MPDSGNNSSLPLLLGITAAVVLCVGGGWLLLEQRDAEPPAAAAAIAPVAKSPTVEVEPQPAPGAADPDIDLRKARMAAQSDLLVFPGEQSALHFYSRVLAAQPDNEPARSELDDILDRIGQQVNRELRAGNLDEAYGVANEVAEQVPDHPLVLRTRTALNEAATRLADDAVAAARAGNDDTAANLRASLAAVPGGDRGLLADVDASIAEIRQSRQVAEQREQQANAAAAKARSDWLASFNNAINSGRLIAPAGDNARDYLAGDGVPLDLRASLTESLVSALLSSTRDRLEAGRLRESETLLQAARELGADGGTVTELKIAINDAYIKREGSRLLPAQELVRIRNVAAQYPPRAQERGTTGWVELAFTVTPSGETSAIEVLDAEPGDTFNKSAIEAASQWLFEPREYRGEIISQRATARIVFRLE